MDQAGRKSVENLTVVTPIPGQRLEPPPELTQAQTAVWRDVVSGYPSDWFARCLPMLSAYCRAVVEHGRVSAVIDEHECTDNPDKIRNLNTLHQMQDRQAKLMAALATKLRMTNQSRYTPQSAATAAKRAGAAPLRPWERATG